MRVLFRLQLNPYRDYTYFFLYRQHQAVPVWVKYWLFVLNTLMWCDRNQHHSQGYLLPVPDSGIHTTRPARVSRQVGEKTWEQDWIKTCKSNT